MVSGI